MADLLGSAGRGAVLGALYLACISMASAAAPANLTTRQRTLASFVGLNGARPSSLVLGANGKLYGTTAAGGPGWPSSPETTAGTVFQLTRSGQLTTLHAFSDDGEGAYPQTPLLRTADGSLYGMTLSGGKTATGQPGNGVIFRIAADGTYSTLHVFSAEEGGNPSFAPLVEGGDGYFYGVAPGSISDGRGCVFRISPKGDFSVLHHFTGESDGALPFSLMRGRDGNFYGTTAGLAYFRTGNGAGTVFRMAPAGQLTTLYTFKGVGDGMAPASLVQTDDGVLYGTTAGGGQDGAGTFFSLTPNGAFISLHRFKAKYEGASPNPGLRLGRKGYFYGTASSGGGADAGTVFKLSRTGTLTRLHEFEAESGTPMSGLVPGDLGPVLFGTTHKGGGSGGQGTVFQLTVW